MRIIDTHIYRRPWSRTLLPRIGVFQASYDPNERCISLKWWCWELVIIAWWRSKG